MDQEYITPEIKVIELELDQSVLLSTSDKISFSDNYFEDEEQQY